MMTTQELEALTVTKQNKQTMELQLVTMQQAVVELAMHDQYIYGDRIRQELTDGKVLRNAKLLYYISE